MENTPALETKRLRLRRFMPQDVEALFRIYSDREANTFLPWFPLETREEAQRLYEEAYQRTYEQPAGYRYAVCLKTGDVPIGYVHVSLEDSHDLGYALRREFWHKGIATEAARAVVQRLRQDGFAYVTATHDVKNPYSGRVMQAVGMRYAYSYVEQWQPKDIPVLFRLYQLNLDEDDSRVYRKYWDQSAIHVVEQLDAAGPAQTIK